MMEQIKKYIRGNKERSHEVIAELEKLGGKNILKLKGNEYNKVYYIERYKYTNANTIDFVSEKSFIGQLIVTHPDWEEIELPKYKYPKTYEACCDILQLEHTFELNDLTIEEETLLKSFIQLKRCRDAYWKIAGDKMGLGKSWEPDWTNNDEVKFIIGVAENEIIKGNIGIAQYILAFPSEEMRDEFKGNFDPDIEICKEFL